MSAVSVEEIQRDRTEIGAVVTAMYASISGPAGPRDWDAQDKFFHENARMMRTEVDAAGRARLKIMSRDDYRENTAPFFAKNDFYEVEIDRTIEIFGDVAHVWSAYEARHSPSDKEPERRGVNTIQLARGQDGVWRIVSMLWDNER